MKDTQRKTIGPRGLVPPQARVTVTPSWDSQRHLMGYGLKKGVL